jgi:hypothetical protein
MTAPIYHTELAQGSDEWLQLRTGLITASEIKLLMTPSLKPANNDKSRSHLYELAAQRISNYTEPSFISEDMMRGWSDEVLARQAYAENYAPVEECGFITREVGHYTVGYSPDALVGDDGLIEAKSRRQKYQIRTICDAIVPEEYMLQIQTGLLITDRKWLDFVSYCGGLPMVVLRVYPDPIMQGAIVETIHRSEEAIRCLIHGYTTTVGLHPTWPTTERIIERETPEWAN